MSRFARSLHLFFLQYIMELGIINDTARWNFQGKSIRSVSHISIKHSDDRKKPGDLKYQWLWISTCYWSWFWRSRHISCLCCRRSYFYFPLYNVMRLVRLCSRYEVSPRKNHLQVYKNKTELYKGSNDEARNLKQFHFVIIVNIIRF